MISYTITALWTRIDGFYSNWRHTVLYAPRSYSPLQWKTNEGYPAFVTATQPLWCVIALACVLPTWSRSYLAGLAWACIMRVSQLTRPLCCGRISDSHMKLAVLIAALCTASCTAINLTAERPKPQLERANKVLALRGGGFPQGICKSTSSPFSTGLFVDCFKATDGLLIAFLWGVLYLLGVFPLGVGKFMQDKVFGNVYNQSYAELGYIRFEILFILSSLVNTAVLVKFAGDSARLLRWSAAVWATTFTLIVIKFHSEKHMITKGTHDWPIIGYDAPYYGIQALHAIIALLVWYGVATSK